jgi:hypothetical protein
MLDLSLAANVQLKAGDGRGELLCYWNEFTANYALLRINCCELQFALRNEVCRRGCHDI